MTNENDITRYNSLTSAEALNLPKEEIIKALDIDELYYGKFGQNWLSNSHLSKLLEDPLLEKPDEVWGDGRYLVIGNFVHKAILEPHKALDFPYSEATHRSQTKYKEDLAASSFDTWMFTKKDFDKWMDFSNRVLSNEEAKSILHAEGNEFEVPQVAYFNGLPIKGKCDIINHEKKVIIDLKTTSDLDSFGEKIDMWNYNVQAALYAKALFPDYDFRFVAVDKQTDRIGVFDMNKSSFETGLKKLYKCTNLWKHYHTDQAHQDKIFYHYM